MSRPEDPIARSAQRAHQFALWLAQLRAGDPTFAQASRLYPDDHDEWNSAVYLLTGCQQVWRTVAHDVLGQATIAPVIDELEDPRRGWSTSERTAMRWAAHFWNVYSSHIQLPYAFDSFCFARWITACHLRQHTTPALTLTEGSR